MDKWVTIPLVGNGQQRDTVSDKDQRFINYLFETTKNNVTNTKRLFTVKRPGTIFYLTVEGPGRALSYTSRPYPVWVIEEIDLTSALLSMQSMGIIIEGIDLTSTLSSGSLKDILRRYSYWSPEGVDLTASIPTGILHQIVRFYSYAPPEGVDLTTTIPTGILHRVVIFYSFYYPEGIDLSAALTGGSLV